jgi:hypothetical protein
LLGVLALVACGDDGRAGTSDTQPVTTFPTTVSTDPSGTSGTSTPTSGTGDPATGGTEANTGAATGTAGESTTPDPTVTSTDPSATDTGTTTPSEPCVGLECQVPVCPGGTTTLRGVVYAPEGTLPLYNVVVYVPNGPLDPIPDGVTCDTCQTGLSGQPIVATLSDTKGEFVLEGVPAGADIPLVLQIGKWRREIVVPSVAPCTETVVTPDLTRLPRNQSEGHIPRIAMVTGGADALECLLRKVGLEDQEFTPEVGAGRVNMFAGYEGGRKYSGGLNDGAPFPKGKSLWDDLAKLKNYDMVLMACEGSTDKSNKSAQARQNIVDYAGVGGRLFFSHWHNIWIEEGAAPFPTAATFEHEDDLDDPFTAKIDMTFPKGMALAQWLVNVAGSAQLGEIVITAGQNTVAAINDAVSTRWIYGEDPTSVQYFTFNAPIGAPEEQQCGRVVDTDIHVSSGDDPGKSFPSGCSTTDLSPQEKVLIFMLFELSSCLSPDDEPPPIPG